MGSVRKEIKGNRYGMWVALGEYYYTPPTKSGRKLIMEKCVCDCGNEKFVQRNHLFSGASTSCGCDRNRKTAERSKIQNRKHGMDGTRLCSIYRQILARCNRKTCKAYKRYGGRGIKCERLKFEDFYSDMGKSYIEHCEQYGEKNTTIDRIDNNGNYCKENCKWSTYKEQNNNQSTNHKIEFEGKVYKSMSLFCEEFGLTYSTFQNYIKQGYDIKDAVNKTKYLKLHPRYGKKRLLG